MSKRFKLSAGNLLAASAAVVLCLPISARADDNESGRSRQYEVRVTNITRGQQFTPLLTVVHNSRVTLFTLGSPASSALATLAEEGNTAPLTAVLSSSGEVKSVVTQAGLLGPGQTRTFNVESSGDFDSLTVGAMLIPTNDAFFAVTIPELSNGWRAVTHRGVAYDAGSEQNDERCNSIPGPFFTECGGPGGGQRVGNGEGFVHVHAGMHGIGDLMASRRDWRNPVVSVAVRRTR